MENKDHEFCIRCGRKLKKPEARAKGYGAVCEKKMRVDQSTRLFKDKENRNGKYDIWIQNGIG